MKILKTNKYYFFKKWYLSTLLFFLFPNSLFAQEKSLFSGKITNSFSESIPFAHVSLKNTNLGTSTDTLGNFAFSAPVGTYLLQVSAVGYEKMERKINLQKAKESLNLSLHESAQMLESVVVTGTMKEVSKLNSAVPVEVFSMAYLQKTPAPALFEALQVVNGVRPQLNCSVCNTGDIHINGMEGAYTMVLIDGMPIVSSLSTVYGLFGIPPSLIERVEIIKGSASTLYGSEAVAGVINVITRNPQRANVLSADIWGTTWGELNLDLGAKIEHKKMTNLLGVNYFDYSNPVDNNGDNFTDLTLQKRVSVFNKMTLERKENRLFSVALRYFYEDRWGGEMQWEAKHRGGNEVYGESIFTKRWELFGTYQLPLKERILFNFSFNSHDQNSVYGNVPFLADQKIAFGQFLWDKKIGLHDLMFGANLRYTFYDDNTSATASQSLENQPTKTFLSGIFVQDEINFGQSTKLLLGLRQDYHPQHGNIFSPRLNLKFSPNPRSTFRLSIGNGFRVVNLFTEEHAALTGAREVVIAEKLKPEQSINLNINYLHFFKFSRFQVSVDANAFYTHFSNKIIPDYTSNDQQIIYANLGGYATNKGFAVNTDWQFEVPLSINAGFTLIDAEVVEADGARFRPLLTERLSASFTASYTFLKSDITVDWTGSFYGSMRLPVVENDYRKPESDPYSLQNIKISKRFRSFEIYGGVKNMFNFTPPANSIMRSFDPFDRSANDPVTNPNGYTFDPTYVYASNQGIRGFVGVKWKFK